MYEVTGANLVAGDPSAAGTDTFTAIDPRTGRPTGGPFHEATPAEIDRAATAAGTAAVEFGGWPRDRRRDLLHAAADALDAAGAQLITAASTESGLDPARLGGELARTTVQLRAFADIVAEGTYVEAVIDTARRHPELGDLPDLRRMRVPVGPVAVFGASNFPLAFSVAGGDTASALAAGCPVVVKAHPSHPATSEIAARALLSAAIASGAPPAILSLLHGRSPAVSEAVVTAPAIRAVGFTGSHRVGRALFDLAAARERPIPVFAEMGSANPVFVTAAAIAARGGDIAAGYVASMTLGNGQFCTKPGLLFVPDDPTGADLVRRIADLVERAPAGTLLNQAVASGLEAQLRTTLDQPGVTVRARSAGVVEGIGAAPLLLTVDHRTFIRTPHLTGEHFGPVAVVVRTPEDRFVDAANRLDGSLTATVHSEPDETAAVAPLVAALRERAGRLVFDGFPTGVAVRPAMHHGGPYPATTDPAHTSVGAAAIARFLRPVAYQNAPAAALPAELRDDNPGRVRRLVDGVWTDAALTPRH